MNPDEYANLDRVEREHWFYVGKRRAVRYWIDRLHPLGPDHALLDFGAGTGLFAAEMAERCRVLAFDSYPESLAILRRRLHPEQVLASSSSGGIPLPDGAIDCATALDVLEHIQDDVSAVAELGRVLRPGGLAVVTVPADPRLWSDWDVALHHHRRYRAADLLGLFGEGWSVEHWAHVNSLAYPFVWWLRRGRRTTVRTVAVRAEDRVPPRLLNRLLCRQYLAQAKWQRLKIPFGVGLLLVARKTLQRENRRFNGTAVAGGS